MEIEPLPCPFCGHEKIRVNEEKKRKGALKGEKVAFAWCYPCGTRGPSAYVFTTPDDVKYREAIERWNERGGQKQDAT